MPVRFIVALLLLAGCAAQSTGTIPPVAVEGARASPVALPGRLVLPEGPGPHAVVILLHGCGGVGPNQSYWVERLRGWGYGSLVLDSLTPRSITSVCAADRQRLVTRFDRAGDVVAAAAWLRTQPGVDGARLAVLGDSHGGSTAATVTLHPFAESAMLQGAVDYYGNCRNAERYGGTPLLALAGTADTWGPPARTCTVFGERLPADSGFELVTYPGVVHAFDNPNLTQRRSSEGHPMQYDAGAASDSFNRVHAFLQRTIGPGG